MAWPAHADVSGRAQVIDGDSLTIGGTRVRLFGIDAPERGQGCQAEGKLWLCGGLAKRRLKDRISGRPVVCEEKDRRLTGAALKGSGGEAQDEALLAGGAPESQSDPLTGG